MPYRAQLGGVFGSGLYERQPAQSTAGDIIDAVTRGATTLIGGAFARKQAEREQARQDAATAMAQRAQDRADSHDAWERTVHEEEVANRREQQARADAMSGYTGAGTTTKDVVTPGSVTSSGLLGAPPKVTAPSITKQKLTIPAAYDFTKSAAFKTEQMKLKAADDARTQSVTDRESVHRANRTFDKNNPLPHGSSGGDSPAVHAQTAVRGQISEANQAVKTLAAQKQKLAPGTIPGDQEKSDAIDEELKPLIARRDSLVNVHDQIAGKLTNEAGIQTGRSGAPTIKGAYKGVAKPNGSTIRGGGESAGAPPTAPAAAKSNSTLRHPGKETITAAEAAALKTRNFTDAQIRARYIVQ